MSMGAGMDRVLSAKKRNLFPRFKKFRYLLSGANSLLVLRISKQIPHFSSLKSSHCLHPVVTQLYQSLSSVPSRDLTQNQADAEFGVSALVCPPPPTPPPALFSSLEHLPVFAQSSAEAPPCSLIAIWRAATFIHTFPPT